MITYVTGDATHPIDFFDGHRYIVHCCNDKGGWGSGFVLALDKLSLLPRLFYQQWKDELIAELPLGAVQYVNLEPDLTVVNLIGQHGTKQDRPHPVRYDAIYNGLSALANTVRILGGTIHMPRMGCGLAGGSWDVVEAIVKETCEGIDVFVYDLPEEGS